MGYMEEICWNGGNKREHLTLMCQMKFFVSGSYTANAVLIPKVCIYILTLLSGGIYDIPRVNEQHVKYRLEADWFGTNLSCIVLLEFYLASNIVQE